MSIENVLIWIVLGGVSGWVASIIMKTEQGLVADIIVGIIGALVGGWVFNQFGEAGVSGLNWWSFLVAIVGAMIVLLIYRLVTGRKL